MPGGLIRVGWTVGRLSTNQSTRGGYKVVASYCSSHPDRKARPRTAGTRQKKGRNIVRPSWRREFTGKASEVPARIHSCEHVVGGVLVARSHSSRNLCTGTGIPGNCKSDASRQLSVVRRQLPLVNCR